MKRELILVFLAFTLSFGLVFYRSFAKKERTGGPSPTPFLQPSPSTKKLSEDKSSRERDGCVITGCAGQICAEKGEEVFTTCEFKPEYSCYKKAICERDKTGRCSWRMTGELEECLEKFETGK